MNDGLQEEVQENLRHEKEQKRGQSHGLQYLDVAAEDSIPYTAVYIRYGTPSAGGDGHGPL